MAFVPIITAVELAIVDRLTRGLGKMVTEVKTYGGEFDVDDLNQVVRRLPACWVTFGGVTRTEPVSTARREFRAAAKFVVMVGARNMRDEQSGRHGGVSKKEVGTNLLVSAVRYLLSNQDLGLPIDYLQPGSVKTLFNTQVNSDAMSVYALEFRTLWEEKSLFLDAFPQGPAGGDLDAVFADYDGKCDPETPDWTTTIFKYYLNPLAGKDDPPDATDQITPQ